MLTVIARYLLSPVVFSLTVILPAAVYWINPRALWFSIPLTVLTELIINWDNFCYYESQGLMILVTLVQVAVMTLIILILRRAGKKRNR